MEKKKYVKPTMKVVKLRGYANLLQASGGGGEGGGGHARPIGYIPGMYQDDMNKLA